MEKLKGKHNYAEFKDDVIAGRVKAMVDIRESLDADGLHVKFSYGNRKLGALVPSVSLIPVADCCNCKLCSRGCYDVRNVCFQKTVQKARANNSAIFKQDRERYFREIEDAVKFLRFFRWHVGGDIKDFDYFLHMVRIAENVPTCEFLVFTKNWAVVNTYLDVKELPANLHVIMSGWRGDKDVNEHHLPVSTPVFPDGSKSCMATESAVWCEGDCTACAKIGGGCWGAKKGDTILFEAH